MLSMSLSLDEFEVVCSFLSAEHQLLLLPTLSRGLLAFLQCRLCPNTLLTLVESSTRYSSQSHQPSASVGVCQMSGPLQRFCVKFWRTVYSNSWMSTSGTCASTECDCACRVLGSLHNRTASAGPLLWLRNANVTTGSLVDRPTTNGLDVDLMACLIEVVRRAANVVSPSKFDLVSPLACDADTMAAANPISLAGWEKKAANQLDHRFLVFGHPWSLDRHRGHAEPTSRAEPSAYPRTADLYPRVHKVQQSATNPSVESCPACPALVPRVLSKAGLRRCVESSALEHLSPV